MIKQYEDLFFYVVDNNSDTIYNKISDTGASISLYPDIAFLHLFEEKELVNHRVYEDARRLLREHGSAHCIFLSIMDMDSLDEFANSVCSVYHNLCRQQGLTNDEITVAHKLCEDLSLSATMCNSFMQLLTYYSTIGNVENLIEGIHKHYTLPVSSKSEGKKIYEQIYRYIAG